MPAQFPIYEINLFFIFGNFLKKFKKLGQANNQNVQVEVKGDDVYVGGAKIVASVPAGNGIVHVVDKVILPPN